MGAEAHGIVETRLINLSRTEMLLASWKDTCFGLTVVLELLLFCNILKVGEPDASFYHHNEHLWTWCPRWFMHLWWNLLRGTTFNGPSPIVWEPNQVSSNAIVKCITSQLLLYINVALYSSPFQNRCKSTDASLQSFRCHVNKCMLFEAQRGCMSYPCSSLENWSLL